MYKSFNSNGLSRSVAVVALCALLAAGGAGVLLAGDKGDEKAKDEEKSGAYLGVYMQDLTRSVREGLDLDVKKGVLVSGVADEGPAASAGIEDGDVIVMFNGRAIESADGLRDAVAELDPGAEVKIQLVRAGESMTVTATLGERPEDFWVGFGDDNGRDFHFEFDKLGHHLERGLHRGHRALMAAFGGPRLGVTTAELNDGLAEYFKTDAESGVLVLNVIEESVAEAAGVEPGDVIQKVDDTSVSSTDELRDALADFEEGDEFALQVLRKGKKQTLKATMDDSVNSFEMYASPNLKFDRHHFRAPRVHVEGFDDEMREELDEMRKELDEMRKELEKERD